MINDSQRREVARKLREPKESLLAHPDEELIRLRYETGCQRGQDIYEHLADLIDCLTCSMEYMPEYSGDEIYPTEAYRCSECGWIVSEGKPTYCPCCGAEVIDEDSAN
jgi:hypothetical protein